MPGFGLDKPIVTKMVNDLDVAHVRQDQFSDFFILPQLDAIYAHCADKLKQSVATKLNASSYGPKPPIELEVPKSLRVSAKSASIIGPNYFRPGTVLYPEDRILYHFIAQVAAPVVEAAMDRTRVFSHKPLSIAGAGFEQAATQWESLKSKFEKSVKTGKYTIALKSDVAQYFTSINQHELVNQLEHQGLSPEMVKFTEKFLTGLTLDRSSRGLPQGIYGSDLLGNSYLAGIDEFISDQGFVHFRYVDDIYILFQTAEDFKSFFPEYVKRLREYDLALNESKTFATAPAKLLREETELDKAIQAAKEEAAEKLTDYEVTVTESGPYGDTVEDILELSPDEEEVELEATKAVFEKLDDFSGEERHRAESFCLSFFRRANDPIAIPYVAKRWARNPDRAREYALYLNRFAHEKKHAKIIDKMIYSSAETMIDYQWAWAAFVMRRMVSVSSELLTATFELSKDASKNEVVRSLLVYPVCAHGSAPRKKHVRDHYSTSPLLVQLAIIHCGSHFTSGERSALMATAQGHGELQAMMCDAFKAEQKAAASA
ncbi:RNA-directed DNA polymerase [Sphingomonas sp. S2-65]|uniref:RNA-directed DNA polymerase n=1 Tax=Sphingomonas sp. S2-65 TaxID=2903960 RepID=UPI001F243AA3|nr:RNA-directed DNA polymerase [Sphingomonas sp. S2-65]UYY59751.1 RNA-directed DNA polymerase [Sphingomonas sp. S2-65]